MKGDNEKHRSWSNRYKTCNKDLKQPSNYIKENLELLKQGSVLDFACGDGRNSIYLAKLGFQVTGADFSQQALERLNQFNEAENVEVKTKLVDLEDEKAVLTLGKFDNIVIVNYKPSVEIFKILPLLLKSKGKIMFTTFNYKQSQISEFPRKYCLEENEFRDVSEQLKLIRLDTFKDQAKHKDAYVFELEISKSLNRAETALL